jgi:hypothetical protein
MKIGIQELVALTFVILVVGFALYRRWKKRSNAGPGCADCASGPAEKSAETPIKLYRRRD